MLKNERFIKIEDLVNKKKYVSLQELMLYLDSSESTVRADLVSLEKQGKLKRLHGGATAVKEDNAYEPSIDEKEYLQIDNKRLIAEYAAKLVSDNDIVYIDAGTTTGMITDYLGDSKATFVTNSPLLGKRLKKRGYKVYVTGGEIKLSTDAFIGTFALEIISKFSFDIGFFGANGISLEAGYTTPDYEEAAVKELAISKCKRRYILADHTKLGQVSSVRFSDFINAELITDEITSEQFNKENVKEVKK